MLIKSVSGRRRSSVLKLYMSSTDFTIGYDFEYEYNSTAMIYEVSPFFNNIASVLWLRLGDLIS